jgi:rod shape-determining protein MreD
MIDYQSGHILRPVKPTFIYLSLLLALLLNFLPFGNHAWVPDWLIICIVFWNIHQYRYVGVVTAFLLGIVMDIHNGSLLGMHAFSYSLVAYIAIAWNNRIIALPTFSQILNVFPLFAFVSVFPIFIHWAINEQIHWWGLTSLLKASIEALLWPFANYLLFFPQRRPIDVDPYRPL